MVLTVLNLLLSFWSLRGEARQLRGVGLGKYMGFRMGFTVPDDAIACAFAAQLSAGDFHGAALNLSGGTVTDVGAEALAVALRQKNPLVKLDLGDNRITDRSAEALAHAKVATLRLYSNPFTSYGHLLLGRALSHNKSLLKLHINRLSKADKAKLKKRHGARIMWTY